MIKKIVLILGLLILLVLLLNYTEAPYYLGLKSVIHVYHYESSDGGFSADEIPEKGLSFERIQKDFETYKSRKQEHSIKLYRCFEKEIWKIWEWHDYLSHPRWKLQFGDDKK